jgi:spore coat protein H
MFVCIIENCGEKMTQPFQMKQNRGSAGRRLVAFSSAILLTISLWGASAPENTAKTDTPSAQRKTSDMLFVENKIWNVELEFKKEQYVAMEPKGGAGMGGMGMPGMGGRGMGGFPGMPGMQPGGPNGANLNNLLAPAMFKEGDSNHDGRLSQQEFVNLGRTWFQKWDASHAGQMDTAAIQKGLTDYMLQLGKGGEKRKKGVGILNVDFPYVKANLVFDGNKIPQVSVRYKGNSTYMMVANSLKHSLKVDLDKGFQGRKLYEVSKLNFNNAVMDNSWMIEALAYRLYRDAGVPAGRTSYARVYVTIPEMFDHKYFGLYVMVEDVDKDFTKAHYDAKQGMILKPFTRQLFEDAGDSWKVYEQIYNPKTAVTETETKRMIEFCKLISHAGDADLAAKIGEYLDLDEVARYLAVTTWLSYSDSLLSTGQNLIVCLHPKTNKFQLLPWDLDLSFGHMSMTGGASEQMDIMHPWSGQNLFLERLFKVDAFKQIYIDRMKEFNKTIFGEERLHKRMDELATILRPAIKEESEEKLAVFDQAVTGKSAGSMVPGMTGNFGMPGFAGGGGFMGGTSKSIKAFATARTLSVENQLAGKTERVQSGGFGGMGGGGMGMMGMGGFGGGGMGMPGFGESGNPEQFMAQTMALSLLKSLGIGQEARSTQKQFEEGFARWFEVCNADHSGSLSEAQLTEGINKIMGSSPLMPQFPGMMGPGAWRGMPGQ